MKILNTYSKVTNKSVKEILKDVNDTGWLEYRKIIDVGDKNYVEHVFSWIGTNIEFQNQKTNNTHINTSIANQFEVKNMSFK